MAAMSLFTVAGYTVTVGKVIAVGAALASMKASASQYDTQIDASRYNAALAKEEARRESARRHREGQRQVAAIHTARAKSGVTMEGTPLLVAAESAAQVEMDVLNAQWMGDNESRLYKHRAKSYQDAKPYAVGTSLLKGVSSLMASA